MPASTSFEWPTRLGWAEIPEDPSTPPIFQAEVAVLTLSRGLIRRNPSRSDYCEVLNVGALGLKFSAGLRRQCRQSERR